jgi:cellulose synthase/poly-beta-1,6-N-acetylglucosamine synthase-like glycosyltransferase
MALMLLLFLGTASVLWFSIFGYVLILGFIALFKRRVEGVASSCPEIAVVIPTLNEEDLVLKKLADLRRTDYPLERVSLVVVDGGSSDRTTELVRAEIARGEDIELVCLNGTKGNAYQVRNILTRLNHEFVVVTDVDSVLEPSCIRELIGVLEADPLTAVVGAQVQPHTRFLEEIIHWWGCLGGVLRPKAKRRTASMRRSPGPRCQPGPFGLRAGLAYAHLPKGKG